MKMLKNTKIALAAVLSVLFLSISLMAEARQRSSVSFQLFYDQLAPYGEWVNDYEYGYIWLPDVGPHFMPYKTNGYWVMTQYGNTWVSNYDWGWAPFHYGRWVHTDYYGWAWIPGYEWGPAWVSWRNGGGHYGWAPLGPKMSIHVRVNIPAHHWVFVPHRHLLSMSIHRHFVPRRNHVRIYNRTTIINNTYVYNNHTYVTGPSRGELERVTRSRINVRQINHASQPGRSAVDNRSVNIYRPSVDPTSRTNARPARVTDASAVRSRVANSSSSNARAASRTAEAPASRSQQRTAAPAARTQQRAEAPAARSQQRTAAPAARTQQRATAPAARSQQRTAAPAARTQQRAEAPAARSQQRTAAPAARTQQRATAPAARSQQRTAAPGARTQQRATTARSSSDRTAVTSSRTNGSSSQNRSATTNNRGSRN